MQPTAGKIILRIGTFFSPNAAEDAERIFATNLANFPETRYNRYGRIRKGGAV